MRSVRCYIGIGSNLGDPPRQVNLALLALAQIPQTQLLYRSPWYVSKAVGPGEQPDYLNGVIELETRLDPETLLQHLQHIETAQGRERSIRWGPRSLDLDILLYGDHCLHTPTLQVPHPRIRERTFVLAPLADLNPELRLPEPAGGKSATIAALLAALWSPADELQLQDGEREVVKL